MLARRREAWTLLLAVALHAAAIASLRVVLEQRRATQATNHARPPSAQVAWDIELTAPQSRGHSQADTPSAAVAHRPPGLALRPLSPQPSPAVEPAESENAEPVEDAEPVDGVVTTPRDSEGEQLARRPIDLGIGSDGWQRWVGSPNEPPPSTADAPRVRSNRFQVFRAPPASTTGGVQEGLEKRDRELGLGPSGRVLSALHHTAHETIAPAAGKATFEVTVLGTGAVQVTLGSVSGQENEWQQVARRIAERLRAAPPRIPPPRKGARFIVELTAEETMPNGTKISSLKGPHIDATPPKLRITEDEQRQLELDNPTAKNDADNTPAPPIQLDLPGVYLAERGKVCSYRLGVSVLGPVFQGGCDPSHIGAKPQRMVHARVLEESLF